MASFVLAIVLSLAWGSASAGLSELTALGVAWITGHELSQDLQLARTILLSIRLPRLLVAAMCGAGLAAAGVVSQGLFRNSLASPSVLGTTAGGGLAAALTFYLGSAYLHWLTLPLAAFTGSLLATSFIFFVAGRNGTFTTESLLLMGFALNALLGSCTTFLVSLMLEDYQTASAVMHWLFGGLTAKGWDHLAMAALPMALGFIAVMRLAPRLDVLSLGEDVASTLSVNMTALKRRSVVGIALLVGTAVSLAGAVPFIGLLVPHFTRLLAGPAHGRLLRLSLVNGMTLMLMADLVARTVRAPREVDVGILTSLMGAPFFIWLLWSTTRKGMVSG